jgi:signal transduction histidine kinase
MLWLCSWSAISQTNGIAAEQLLSVKEQLKYPDSALIALGEVDLNVLNDSLLSEYYRLKGSAYFYKGIKDSAVVYFSTAMKIAEKFNCNDHYSLIANGMAVVLQSVKLYDQAIDHYTKALICVEERNDQQLKLKLLTNLSVLNREVGNNVEARRFVRKAYELSKSLDDQSSLASILNAEGQVHLQSSEYDSAYMAFNKSLAFRSPEDKAGKAICLNNLGYVSSLMDKNSEAIEYYRLAENLRTEIGDLAGTASLQINMGNIYVKTGDLDLASQYFENASIINQQVNDPSFTMRILLGRANLAEAKGNIELSHNYLQDYINMNDSMSKYESVQKIASSPYQVALLEAENKVRQIELEQGRRDEALSRQRLINLMLTIGISVIIGILSLFVYQLKMLSDLRKTLTIERDKAKSSAEMRRRTLNTIVHELKTPMNAIVSLTELLAVEVDPKEIQEMTSLLHKSAQRLVNTTNNVLTFSRVEQGSVPMVTHKINVSQSMNDLINMMEPQFRSKGLLVEREIKEDVILHLDQSALDIIVMNLISNAYKYTDNGAVYVGLKEEVKHVIITIKDTGIGIAEDQIEQIFAPFYQVNKKTTGREGTGLGLYICKYYVELLKGSIIAESEEGMGTTFIVTLPRIPDA